MSHAHIDVTIASFFPKFFLDLKIFPKKAPITKQYPWEDKTKVTKQILTETSISCTVQSKPCGALAPWAADGIGTDTILAKSWHLCTLVDIWGNKTLGIFLHHSNWRLHLPNERFKKQTQLWKINKKVLIFFKSFRIRKARASNIFRMLLRKEVIQSWVTGE